MWQTIITAAGDDDLVFRQAGFAEPKNWVKFRDLTILESAIASYGANAEKTAVILREVELPFWFKSEPLQATNASSIFISNSTQGALCTALLGLDGFDLSAPLVVAPGDSILRFGISEIVSEFLSSGVTAATVLFESSDARYSYARLMPNSDISEMAEKRLISNWASTGLFLFKRAQDFLDAGTWVLKQNMRTGNEFFMSSSLNYLVMRGDRVRGINLPATNKYIRLATPFDLLGESDR